MLILQVHEYMQLFESIIQYNILSKLLKSSEATKEFLQLKNIQRSLVGCMMRTDKIQKQFLLNKFLVVVVVE